MSRVRTFESATAIVLKTQTFQYRVAPSTDNGDYYYMTGVFRTSEQRVTGKWNFFKTWTENQPNWYALQLFLVVEEKATYQKDELISNIGGYLGLVLGLRIVHIYYW